MNDLISRQAAIDAIRAYSSKYTGFMEMEMYTDDDAVEAIQALPSVQPEQKHGRWVKYKNWYACSECGKEMFFAGTYDESQHYCYNCGARMDGET